MASNSHFAKTPNINIPRSKFNMCWDHATSWKHGELIPIACFDILPGDTMNLSIASLIRMSTPIVPIMGNIDTYIHAFFVPMRLVWENTAKFFGENDSTAGPQTTVYSIPTYDIGDGGLTKYSVGHYLGKPLIDSEISQEVSCLKERAYCLIWNEWYRAQQLQNPVIINLGGKFDGSYGAIGAKDGHAILSDFAPFNVCKKFDYFTAATISPQYGEAVSLPLGSYAPIVLQNNSNVNINSVAYSGLSFTNAETAATGGKTAKVGTQISGKGVTPANIPLLADLSEATAAKINDIRYAFQVQKYLERSNFGSRFFEMLAVHYGVTSPDSRLQRPEYLGGTKFGININQVLSTADAQAGSTTKLGQTGAVSVTGNKSHLFNKGFVEPGFVMILMSQKHDRSYSQGILREDLKTNRFEIYSPEFANLGDQEIKIEELYAEVNDGSVFGYQEHWAEYRYRPSQVSGDLDPNSVNPLDFWTLADKYTNRPVLGPSFIEEDRNALSRCLVTGSNGPDYIGDFYFDCVAIREMPTYSIPGLVDHFGVM